MLLYELKVLTGSYLAGKVEWFPVFCYGLTLTVGFEHWKNAIDSLPALAMLLAIAHLS